MPKKVWKYFNMSTIPFAIYIGYLGIFVIDFQTYKTYNDPWVLITIYILIWIPVYIYYLYTQRASSKKGKSAKDTGTASDGRNSFQPESVTKPEKESPGKQKGTPEKSGTDKPSSFGPTEQRKVVSYRVNERFLEGTKNRSYPLVVPPILNSEIGDLKKSKNEVVKGVSEKDFIDLLKKSFPGHGREAGALDIPGTQLDRVYSPDAILNLGEIFIDIEIDEPYVGSTRRPTHCINSYDVDRNKVFSENGWMVVRFAEEQIVKQPDECIFFLVDLISTIDSNLWFTPTSMSWPSLVPQWTMAQAEKMAKEGYREKYLGITFTPKEEAPPKEIEYDPNSDRNEKPKSNLPNETKFVPRDTQPKKEEPKPAVKPKSQAKSSSPIYENKDTTNPIRPTYSPPNYGNRKPSDKPSSPGNVSGKKSDDSVETQIREAIDAEHYMFFTYNLAVGTIKPTKIVEENESMYVYGREVISKDLRKFKIDEINKTSIRKLSNKFQKGTNKDTAQLNRVIDRASNFRTVAKVVYQKDGELKHYDLTDIKKSKKYNNCIQARPDKTGFNMTLSRAKIVSIEVTYSSCFYSSQSKFGLSPDYSERPKAKPKRKPSSSNSRAQSSSYTAPPSSNSSNSGCIVIIVVILVLISLFNLINS
jgi:hypothetical protein